MINSYQKLAMRTKGNYKNSIDQIICSSLGLCGEAGEVSDALKKMLYQGHETKLVDIDKEVGDILWYIALYCDARGITISDIAKKNIEKLENRYPNLKFEIDKSVNRNDE